jgi:DNA-binding transcriptional regulator YiaG
MIAQDPELAPPTQSLAPLLDMREIRRKLRLTQAQLAKNLHVAVATLREWEHGRGQTHPALQALLRVLDKLPSLRSPPSTSRRDGQDNRTTPRRSESLENFRGKGGGPWLRPSSQRHRGLRGQSLDTAGLFSGRGWKLLNADAGLIQTRCGCPHRRSWSTRRKQMIHQRGGYRPRQIGETIPATPAKAGAHPRNRFRPPPGRRRGGPAWQEKQADCPTRVSLAEVKQMVI